MPCSYGFNLQLVMNVVIVVLLLFRYMLWIVRGKGCLLDVTMKFVML